jgi:hypothetical protein
MRVEVYLLPLVNNSAYNELRQIAGGGTVKYSPSRIPPTTVLRYLLRLPAEAEILKRRGIGDWALLHIDAKGLNLEPLIRSQIGRELGHKISEPDPELVPLLLSAAATDPRKVREAVRELVNGKDRKITESKHRGVTTSQFTTGNGILPRQLHDAIPPRVYAVTWNKALLHRWIDNLLDAPKEKPTDEVEVNTSLYLAPPGGKNVEAISAALEWETHKRALSAVAAWQALHSAGAVTAKMTAEEQAGIARRLLGHVPASPDGSAFVVDRKLGLVTNQRHGLPARPVYHAALGAGSTITQLFSQARSVRIDLRFREDGIHTTMTIDWIAARK